MKKLVLPFVSLLFYAVVTSDSRGTDYSPVVGFIYYDKLPITAEPGSSAEFGCVFDHSDAFKPTHVILRKCKPGYVCVIDENNIVFNSADVNATTGEFSRLVALMETDLSKKNCSIRIDYVSISMNGSYQIGLKGQRNGRPAQINTAREKPIKVTGLRQPRIIGQTSVEQGRNLNLTCTAQSSPPSDVIWTVDGSDTPLMSGNQTATLFIPMVTLEHSGKYICTAKHLNETKTTFTHVFVISRSSHQMMEAFMTGTLALAAIVFLVIVVALTAMILHWFFRCKKSCRDQTDAPEMVIPQDQQTGDGVHGHEQNVQEGGGQVTLVTQPFPRLQMSILPPAAQRVLPSPSPSTRSPQGGFPALAMPPPPAFPPPPPPSSSPHHSLATPPPPVAPKPSRSGSPTPVVLLDQIRLGKKRLRHSVQRELALPPLSPSTTSPLAGFPPAFPPPPSPPHHSLATRPLPLLPQSPVEVDPTTVVLLDQIRLGKKKLRHSVQRELALPPLSPSTTSPLAGFPPAFPPAPAFPPPPTSASATHHSVAPPPPLAVPKPSRSGPTPPVVSLDQILLGKKRLRHMWPPADLPEGEK